MVGKIVQGLRQQLSVAIVLLWVLSIPMPAHADSAAGRQAYDRGDYRRAMVEWQAAADHNDPEAEFGLGNLYEFGAGDQKQDYTRAAYWYRKAAEQGSTGAEYRLALLYSAGGDNFEIDLAEAYKWASLAAQSQGVWGTLAEDFQHHLDRSATDEQRFEAAKRARKWEEERVAVAEVGRAPLAGAASPESIAPSWRPPKPPISPPGWPDVPVGPKGVEGLPPPPFSIDGKQPSASAALTPRTAPTGPRKNIDDELRSLDCAILQSRFSPEGEITVTGTIPSADQRTKLVQIVNRINPGMRNTIDVGIVPPPICRTLAAFDKMRRSELIRQAGMDLRLAGGATKLREGDPIAIAVRGPSFTAAMLRIDYFALDGRVLHMWPNQEEPILKLAPGAGRIFDHVGGAPWNVGGPPFGTELIVAIATAEPLNFGEGHPPVEDAERYLRDLEIALGRVQKVARSSPSTVASLLVTTSPR